MTTPQSKTTDLRELSAAECRRLLEAQDVGRIAIVTRNGQPLIFPVNYVFDEGVVVFKTNAGAKLALAPQALVAFEIDGWDRSSNSGWSVLVQGVAHDVTRTFDFPSSRLRRLQVDPMAPGERQNWIGVWANEISGRAF
jgi:nitroimidazol reductase NimA-like FMN-containing flavoprotein (pyridoxamine 5'-phosphate oxidase superfamily)